VFYNRVLRRLLGTKREEAMVIWRNMRIQELLVIL
jgi:hypothetical protein